MLKSLCVRMMGGSRFFFFRKRKCLLQRISLFYFSIRFMFWFSCFLGGKIRRKEEFFKVYPLGKKRFLKPLVFNQQIAHYDRALSSPVLIKFAPSEFYSFTKRL